MILNCSAPFMPILQPPNNHTYCYLARGGKKVQEQALDDKEEIIVQTFTIPEVKLLLAENKIAQALHCTGLFYALMKLGVVKS